MVIDLHFIRQTAIQKQAENAQLKEQLKSIPTKEVDALVQQLNADVSSKIDCTKCANCCNVLEPPVDNEETETLARLKGISLKEFATTYIGEEPASRITYLKCQPCIFLKEATCSIYALRPASCADYPHLTQPNFKYRWKSVMTNYALCPIVFNVVEALKRNLNTH